ncbi:hypothetical protein TNCV_4294801 [Trichonephila clavipes]|uniref:Uncharacterized protein n=1 Tax=Trichonephila clavipes TaxID=2585209 RepID=A0A8X6V0A1_TRICX|nr:hypothetical protein TNCV_4294801 [Trichonephila clavipes]
MLQSAAILMHCAGVSIGPLGRVPRILEDPGNMGLNQPFLDPPVPRGLAVDSLVVRASDSRPEGLGFDTRGLRVHKEYMLVKSVGPKYCGHERRDWRIFPSPSVQGSNCGGGDRWCRHLSSPSGNFDELNRTVTCMVLKTNDRRTSSPLPR